MTAMSSQPNMDWKVGDLAAFAGGVGNGAAPADGKPTALGEVRRVDGVVVCLGSVGLVFDFDPSPHPTKSWDATQWRKIRPDEHEACEDEFVTLLTNIRHKKVREHVKTINDFYKIRPGKSA